MGMGLRLFEGINIVEEARDRVFTLVEHLQSRSLVTKKEAYITVHDVVRDVSKRIASTKNGSLVLEQGVTWERSLDKTSPEHCTRISIISNEITELPSQLQFPKLNLLRCSNKGLQRIPDSCFEGMAKLQVLDINRSLNLSLNHLFHTIYHPYSSESWTVLKLPSSLQSLTSLHTLCLQDFRLEDFTAIKYLQNLEILRIVDQDIKELPNEIGQLTKLRLLDMSDCIRLKRISPGIISGLTVLEELYLGGLDIDWGAKENEEGRIAAHKEFESLSNLYILHIVIKDPSFLPLFKNLKKYKIQIGDVEYDFIKKSQNYERTLSISGVALEKNYKFLLHHSEALLLKGESTKSLVGELLKEASQSIKYLVISETDTLAYLANAMDCTKAPFLPSTLESLKLEGLDNLQQIINGPLVPGNLAKLKKLDVRRCKQLRNIFRLSNAVDVLHLEYLDVDECEIMEEVICWEGREEEANKKLQFSNLKLCVSNCKQLRNIFRMSNAVDVLHLEELRVEVCEIMEEIIKWEGREEEANKKLQFPNLKTLEIIRCESLTSFCKGANEIEFHWLERIYLRSLPAVKTFFPPKVLFPKLVAMKLWFLENMKEIVDGPLEAGSLVNLKELGVFMCNQLRNIFRLPTETDTMHLEKLWIWECESMEEVIKWEGREEDATSNLQFPKLMELEIKESGVICFCRGAKEIEFHQLCELSLKNLRGVECLISNSNENRLKYMFPHKVLFPKLVTMHLFNLTNMKEIVEGALEAGSLVKLKQLDVSSCSQLRNIFELPTETDTVHLETLKIEDCESMEEVIKWEGREEDATSNLQFPKLQWLEIKRSTVICFCRGAKEIEFHQLDYLELSELHGVECLISGSYENPLKSMFPHKVLFPKLNVGNCNQLRNIFRLPTEIDTVHLEELEIKNCESMEEVIKWEGREEDATSKLHFPKLTELEIKESGVICFCRGAKEIEIHQLCELSLKNLPGVECLISGSNENPLKSMFPHKLLHHNK